MRDMIVVINLDGRATRSLAQKLRAEHLYCRVMSADASAEEILAQEAMGILLAGGALGEAPEFPALPALLEADRPMLAMGDAALTLCMAMGGSLSEAKSEGGVMPIRYADGSGLLKGIPDGERYVPVCRFMAPPAALTPLALTDGGILGFHAEGRAVYGLAFQAEQNDPDSIQLLLNFCVDVCGCSLWWNDRVFIERAVSELRDASDGGEALCTISGGVDSGVCAMLGYQALGSRLHCLFVDTGLLRKDEGDRVVSFFRDTVGLDVTRINAAEEFLKALEGVTDPVEKERIIFALLRAITRREISQNGNIRLLIQGTNYSDTIDEEPPIPLESQGARVRIAEPVRELFKEEIRHVAEELDMPAVICRRQPFPGSGLALRILSEVTPEKLDALREADAILREEVETANQNRRLWQYYATLSDNLVPGYEGYIIALRAVQAADGDTAVAARLPMDLLERATERILRVVPGVYRVLYDLTPSRSYARVGQQ